MDRIRIDHVSAVPPYEQVRSQVSDLVTRGELAPGTRLPTVRQTASTLGLAVNTVARAYRELEASGVVVTRGRQGTFVHSGAVDGMSQRSRDAHRAAESYVEAAHTLGLSRTEAMRLVDEIWD